MTFQQKCTNYRNFYLVKKDQQIWASVAPPKENDFFLRTSSLIRVLYPHPKTSLWAQSGALNVVNHSLVTWWSPTTSNNLITSDFQTHQYLLHALLNHSIVIFMGWLTEWLSNSGSAISHVWQFSHLPACIPSNEWFVWSVSSLSSVWCKIQKCAICKIWTSEHSVPASPQKIPISFGRALFGHNMRYLH